MGKLFEELKRRKVFRVAAVYAVVAWVLIQVTSTVLPTFEAPDWVNQSITLLFILGFPMALVLSWAYEVTPEGIKSERFEQASGGNLPSATQPINYVILIIVLTVAVFQFTDRFFFNGGQSTTSEPSVANQTRSSQVVRAAINLGDFQRRPSNGNYTMPAQSDDGTLLGFTGFIDNVYKLTIREVASLESRVIFERPGIWIGMSVKISPDNQRVLFNDAQGLHVIPISGGPSKRISSQRFNSWNWISEDKVIFAPSAENPVFHTVSVSSGEIQPLDIRIEQGESHQTPFFLPDRRNVLFTSGSREASLISDRDFQNVELLNLDTLERRVLIDNAFAAQYAPSGHLLYMRGNELWGIRFSLDTLDVEGDELLLVSGIETLGVGAAAAYTISNTGRLVYMQGGEIFQQDTGAEVAIIDSQGYETTLDLPNFIYREPAISPQGNKIAITAQAGNGTQDIWIYDLESERLNAVTFSGVASSPIWSDDGNLVYYSDNSLGYGIWAMNANGSGQSEQLINYSTSIIPVAFVSKSEGIVFQTNTNGVREIYLASKASNGYETEKLLPSRMDNHSAALSPDGNWLAYTSSESGREEVYLHPFPNVEDGTWQVTHSHASKPQWNHNGQELFYTGLFDGTVYKVSFNNDSGVRLGRPEPVLQIQDLVGRSASPSVSVFPDGSRAVYVKSGQTASLEPMLVQANIIENFGEELSRLLPP